MILVSLSLLPSYLLVCVCSPGCVWGWSDGGACSLSHKWRASCHLTSVVVVDAMHCHAATTTTTRSLCVRVEWVLKKKLFLKTFFASGVGFPLYPENYSTLLHNDHVAHQDHCGKCRIQTWDLCPRSLVRYQWATISPAMSLRGPQKNLTVNLKF